MRRVKRYQCARLPATEAINPVAGQFQSEPPFPLVEMKSTIHEVTRNRTKKLVFRDASCDFVDRPLPSKQKNFTLTYYCSDAIDVHLQTGGSNETNLRGSHCGCCGLCSCHQIS